MNPLPSQVSPSLESQLTFKSLLKSVSKTLKATCTEHCNGQVFQLTRGDRVQLIQGSHLPINSSSSAAACSDQAACSDLLKRARIWHVRHRIFVNPIHGDWAPKEGTLPQVHAYASKRGYPLMCQSQGLGRVQSIHKVSDVRSLEAFVVDAFSHQRDVVLSRFRPYKEEYRLIIYGNCIELILKGHSPKLLGMGKALFLN